MHWEDQTTQSTDNQACDAQVLVLSQDVEELLSLEVPMKLLLKGNLKMGVTVLIDTGAQVNLIQKDLIPKHLWDHRVKQVSFRTANKQIMKGGDKAVKAELQLRGRPAGTKGYCQVTLPVLLYGADIEADIILSYPWLRENGMVVAPGQHAMVSVEGLRTLWFDGLQGPQRHWRFRGEQFPKNRNESSLGEETKDVDLVWLTEEECEIPDFMISQVKELQFYDFQFEDDQGKSVKLCVNELKCVSTHWFEPQENCPVQVATVIQSAQQAMGAKVEQRKTQILKDYEGTVYKDHTNGDPPVRGPLGEAEIRLKPGAVPKKQRPFHIVGERRAAMMEMLQKLVKEKKIESGVSEWLSPAFPVPKKETGKYRLVVDYRALNDATLNDTYPLPKIEDIIQRQSENRMWSVIDLKDGYHQVPLKKESRPYTCMSTPMGAQQWSVLVMGLKNAGPIFQRVMDWVFREEPNVDPYEDDCLVGSKGSTEEELLANHEKDLRKVMEILKENQLVVNKKKTQLFVREVEFCGQILSEGKRRPSPGKLLAVQKWELPRTVTQLRAFLGVCTYYSSYVKGFASYAAPLTSMLQLDRKEGRKGSQKVLSWTEEGQRAFEDLKMALTANLELFQVQPDKPFVLKTDASRYAIGAVLEQEVDGKRVPVAFYSRKLAQSQRNWTPREQETYAVVSALRKWAGWINYQPVVVLTDHKALEDWVSEKVDTPSGPAGRRARWHETLSKFDLRVQYVPGKDNVVADALSRWAYPASKALQDCSWHGSTEGREEVKKILEEELEDGKKVAFLTNGALSTKCLVLQKLSDETSPAFIRHNDLPAKGDKECNQIIDSSGNEMVEAGGESGEQGTEASSSSSNIPSFVQEQESLGRDIFNVDWSPWYQKCDTWGEIWRKHRSNNLNDLWERGIKFVDQGGNLRMLVHEKIAIPKRLCLSALMNCHIVWGHPGQKRLAKEFHLNFAVGPNWNFRSMVKYTVEGCEICQSCEAPNWRATGPIEMTALIDAPMRSVCLDFFSMPSISYEGEEFDYLFLCVDRFSGWIVALPCNKKGMTAERAAKSMVEKWWDWMGVPSVITCDRGPQFVGQWWQTVCAKLGVRIAYSQAHRPQSNGRAEVAGQCLIKILNKLHAEKELNWVEDLPRVLRIYHDRIGETGYSPYQLMFGRERAAGGINYTTPREHEEACHFMERVEQMDAEIHNLWTTIHANRVKSVNTSRTQRLVFKKGDPVWVLKPQMVGGHKMETKWLGPCKVVMRVGDSSYQVEIKENVIQDVHLDFLKPVVENLASAPKFPLFYFQGLYADAETAPDEFLVEKIVDHRLKKGKIEFLVKWRGFSQSENTWEPPENFIYKYNDEWLEYCRKKALDLKLLDCVGD